MAFDRKPGGFGGHKGSGGFRAGGGRPSFGKPGFGGKRFGGPRRDDARPAQMHPATCADCGTSTEVPFRPNGSRPIYCKDCLAKREPMRRDVSPRGDFGARREAPRFEHRDRDAAPRPAATDKRIDDLFRSVSALSTKLDMIADQLVRLAPSTKDAAQQDAAPTVNKKVVKAVKAAPKKAAKAAKPVAKKAAKKAVKKGK